MAKKAVQECIFDGKIDVIGAWFQVKVWRGAGFFVEVRDALGDEEFFNLQNSSEGIETVYDRLCSKGMPNPIAYNLSRFIGQIISTAIEGGAAQ